MSKVKHAGVIPQAWLKFQLEHVACLRTSNPAKDGFSPNSLRVRILIRKMPCQRPLCSTSRIHPPVGRLDLQCTSKICLLLALDDNAGTSQFMTIFCHFHRCQERHGLDSMRVLEDQVLVQEM